MWTLLDCAPALTVSVSWIDGHDCSGGVALIASDPDTMCLNVGSICHVRLNCFVVCTFGRFPSVYGNASCYQAK